MPFLRSLLLLLALVSPAFSQDGPRDAATAQDAGQAFGIYLDGVLKSGGEPDFTNPPAADLFRHIFDVAALKALPPAKADDIPWLLQWAAAVDQSYTRIILFGVKPGQAPAELVLRRNMAEYEDQCAMAMNFLIRFAARGDDADFVPGSAVAGRAYAGARDLAAAGPRRLGANHRRRANGDYPGYETR